MLTQVKSIQQLKDISLQAEGAAEFFILLKGGVRSRKLIDWFDDTDTWHVENLSDGTEQELTEAQLMDEDYTNIGKAMLNGSLYYEEEKSTGDRVIRVIVHVDTLGREDIPSDRRTFYHQYVFCANEQSALRTMNMMLDDVLDDGATMRSNEDLVAVNAALAETYDEPCNLNAYASWEDLTEEVIVKCSEAFCEHHWSYDALMNVAEELGIDPYDIEKS